MKAFEFTTPFKANIPTKLGLFSDIHFDSPDCDKATLKEHLDYCLQDKRYILINGDLFDAILLKDKKRAVPHLVERTDNQLNVKLDEMAHFLTPYKDQILFIARGNHEESIIKYSGLDLIQMLIIMLNAGNDHQIKYGNYSNFVRFDWVDKKEITHVHYDIFMHHGAGGSAPVTKGMLDFSRLSKGVNADLIWIGHKHQSIVDYSDPVMYIDSNGEIKLKNRQLIQTPSYQKGRTIDYNVNYAERFYCHTALSGFGEVNLIPVYENNTRKIKSEIKITTKPQAILGEVVSAKLKQKRK
jgi:predicted phosphodiesterase